jgi:hypothetical protein
MTKEITPYPPLEKARVNKEITPSPYQAGRFHSPKCDAAGIRFAVRYFPLKIRKFACQIALDFYQISLKY